MGHEFGLNEIDPHRSHSDPGCGTPIAPPKLDMVTNPITITLTLPMAAGSLDSKEMTIKALADEFQQLLRAALSGPKPPDAGAAGPAERQNSATGTTERQFSVTVGGDEQPEAARPISPFHVVRTYRASRPAPGPTIAAADVTADMLTGELTAEHLRAHKDPAAFLNARLQAVREPTPTVWVDQINGKRASVNPSYLSSADQATAMLERLRRLGFAGGEIEEITPENPFSRIDFAGEDRRFFYVGGLNIGLLVERYAKYPVEVADEMTRAEVQRAAAEAYS